MANETTHLNSNNNNSKNTSKGWILHFYTIFSCFTVFWLLLILLFQLFVSILSLKQLEVIDTGVRLYLVTFSIIGILIELEITAVIRSSNLCQAWEYRGFYFVFIGLLHAYTNSKNSLFESVKVVYFLQLIAYFMMICGVIYLILGLFNLKKVRDDKMARYIQLISVLEVESTIRKDSSHSGIGIDGSRF